MLLTLLKILTLQRQTVFAYPWVLCYLCCPPVSSRQVSPCKDSSILFLLCLPKPSVAWFLTHLSCFLVSLAHRGLFPSGLFCLCTFSCWLFSLSILSELHSVLTSASDKILQLSPLCASLQDFIRPARLSWEVLKIQEWDEAFFLIQFLLTIILPPLLPSQAMLLRLLRSWDFWKVPTCPNHFKKKNTTLFFAEFLCLYVCICMSVSVCLYMYVCVSVCSVSVYAYMCLCLCVYLCVSMSMLLSISVLWICSCWHRCIHV